MVDRDRVLALLDELDGYQRELRSLRPSAREGYVDPAARRACERLLQISIETVLTICHQLVAGLRLGLPARQDDVLEKVVASGALPRDRRDLLRRMKGFRNILVHDYGDVNDDLAFEFLTTRLGDFDTFAADVRAFLARGV